MQMFTGVDKVIRRRVNSLPAGSTLAANASFPISERRCHFVVFL